MQWLHTKARTLFTIMLASALAETSATAAQPAPVEAAEPCATVTAAHGTSRVMDATRTILNDGERGVAVACGGWVMVSQGTLSLEHRDGYRMTFSADSFAQLNENNLTGHFDREALTLFRGQVMIRSPQGSPTFQGITPDGRVRLANATGLLIYATGDEETQLIALDGKSSLENRFLAEQRVTVAPGEVTSMSRKTARTMPSIPQAVAIASLRGKLDGLRVREADRDRYLARARTRADRTFASVVKPKAKAKHPLPDEVDSRARILAQKRSEAEKKKIQAHVARRLAGGHASAEEIVFPSRFHGKEGRLELEVEDVAARYEQSQFAAEDLEKKRLIEELAHIQAE